MNRGRMIVLGMVGAALLPLVLAVLAFGAALGVSAVVCSAIGLLAGMPGAFTGHPNPLRRLREGGGSWEWTMEDGDASAVRP